MSEAQSRQKRRQRLPVDGFLLLNKPVGASSNQALQQMRHLFSAARAGHTGTLDPLASGLLPLAFGEATKFGGFLLEADKGYRARIQLGQTTDSGDAEGRVLETAAVDFDVERIRSVVAAFQGESEQIPPMYSALKRDGKPLYAYARAGLEVKREARPIRIEEIFADDFDTDQNRFSLHVRCSKGTYIRTLAEDIGQRLGCGAHLVALCRNAIGALRLTQAYTPQELTEFSPEQRLHCLHAPDMPLQQLPALHLDAQQTRALRQGQSVAAAGLTTVAGLHRLYGDGGFFGLGQMRPADQRLHPQRLLAQEKSAVPPAGR